MRPTRAARTTLIALLLGALLASAACGKKAQQSADAGGGAGAEQSSAADGVWRVLADGARVYDRLGEIRFELEHRCMDESGYPVHPTVAAGPSGWTPVSRDAPRLAPTVAEAEQDGFGPEEAYSPVAEAENPLWKDQASSYVRAYKRAYEGDDGCRATVRAAMFGNDAPEGDEPIPLPDSFSMRARWELYYAMPQVVTALTTWRACMKESVKDIGYGTVQDVRAAAEKVSAADAKLLAKATARCVDGAGWRDIHAAAWSEAMDRLVREEEPAIRGWRERLNRVLDDAEGLLR
ncbi:hypothetical protein Afil01_18820 [Actinorhabdospora filicis]|uniref:Lipoprotein n=1 Tax=Actinorhabdospora filicis TaxID=1785913 RepID=A0A9W6W9X7_9ACTN|nr:hypothetical protein [Actinorhabdospora filicis]GLZ77075.1 hypothetical protein Afil01_18820 [Actinorhabdospora filicis]